MDTPRRIITLDGEWRFAYSKNAPDTSAECFPKEDEYEVKLPVPAYWDDCKSYLKYAKFWSRGCTFFPEARRVEEFPLGGLKPPDASLPYLLGTGWYKKTFPAGADWGEKSVTLKIGGAMLDAWVWLNGKFVKSCYSCGKPFEVILDGIVRPGERNELIIAVSNTRRNRIGCSIRGYKGMSGGINRSVALEISEGARIEDCYVRTSAGMDTLTWEIRLRKRRGEALKLRWSILDPHDERTLGRGICDVSGEELRFETETFGMRQWSDNCPFLYKLRLELAGDDGVIDRLEQDYGLRFAERRGTKLFLNGKPIFLRGATDHAYFPETCTVPNDLSYYMRTIKALKAAGFNWMRFHTTIPPEECMEAADRLGMLIQAETQNGFEEQDFLDMLTLCRKHPSVILYCCGNEVPITEKFEQQLEKMGSLVRKYAPDCLYDPVEALLNVECRLDEGAPGYTQEPVPYNAIKLERIRNYSDVFAPGVWVFSYHSLYADVEKINRRMDIYRRPCLIHEAGIFDTYLNLDLERRYENTRIGTDLFRAVRQYVSEMGLLDRAPVYYRNSCRWMKILMKFALEKSRRCETIAGYDFLGAIDCHWHRTGYAVGVMNEFYELKAGFTLQELQQFNGESILVSDAGHERNLFAGDRKKVRIFASLYGGEKLERGILTWSLLDDRNHVRSSGSTAVREIEHGRLSELARVDIGLDEVHGIGEHVRLRAELNGGIYVISNEWDYWVFRRPCAVQDSRVEDGDQKDSRVEDGTLEDCIRKADIQKEGIRKGHDVKVVTELTREDVEAMEKGDRILLLGKGPFPGLPVTFQITPGGRVNGNCATVIYDHSLMREFPQEGFCDWQFMPMFQDAEAVVFNDLEMEFRPILEIVSTYKMIKKQASIFETKTGRGGMLVCTMNVRTQDPAAAALYDTMLRYLSSEEFRPQIELGADRIYKLMEAEQGGEADFSTDECYDTGGHIEV